MEGYPGVMIHMDPNHTHLTNIPSALRAKTCARVVCVFPFCFPFPKESLCVLVDEDEPSPVAARVEV